MIVVRFAIVFLLMVHALIACADDHNVLRLVEPPTISGEDAEKQKIEAALLRIESSPLKFIRNGDEHDGKAAADHLRQKLKSAGDKVKTFDDFVEQVATRSSMSGEAYLVKLQDGKTVELAKWLREPPGTQPSK